MIDGMIGKKLGMVQIFDESGHAFGVTVVEAGPCTVIQKRENSKVQLGFFEVKESKVTKPRLGVFKKAGTVPFRILKEFSAEDFDSLAVGQEIRADIFNPGDVVKVIGTSKGKGFAGVMKRWNFGGGRETHGSRSHRIPGSVGQCAWPSRVFKGKKLPGRLGGAKVTAPSVKVVDVRADENLIFLKGPVPGAKGTIVFIRKK
ncbi:MAG: 50S ribosomal protein L3 [Desulfomonile tiedjei]|uniref:Large ribosomal subunit protein uL3 n=1 Tax=Desulfomonile tiedjei TaxID=2358 RepID=A0A9D6Z1D2_9BACT|nr:50S ribosomal protein L3 [Desulfomonile tiedjei]